VAADHTTSRRRQPRTRPAADPLAELLTAAAVKASPRLAAWLRRLAEDELPDKHRKHRRTP
jgi:hypothetical protein